MIIQKKSKIIYIERCWCTAFYFNYDWNLNKGTNKIALFLFTERTTKCSLAPSRSLSSPVIILVVLTKAFDVRLAMEVLHAVYTGI